MASHSGFVLDTLLRVRPAMEVRCVPDVAPSDFMEALLTSAKILWPSAKTQASPLTLTTTSNLVCEYHSEANIETLRTAIYSSASMDLIGPKLWGKPINYE
ncbi:hypothetical protein GJ744_004820 [Endocarpon pusillum]|uniref:Uncharacterized protein n=1 Tax=Endocarpon pusillum TaxID=364733 RepID=A0A8H7DZ11_9EURO|nr:hypothetical protein GJ744_004820 [Endocarpon pusillum]